MSILDLGIQFRYDKKLDLDILTIKLAGKSKEVPLSAASSGFQSIIPLIVVVDYLTHTIYDEKEVVPIEDLGALRKELELYRLILQRIKVDSARTNDSDVAYLKDIKNNFEKHFQILQSQDNKNRYQFSSLIIEEPEQNLFPETQISLMYYLLEVLQDSRHDHQLLLTTHSPFIINAVNNCMMGFLIKNNQEVQLHDFPTFKAWIAPEKVSIWQIEDGRLINLKEKDTGLLRHHYFNDSMNKLTHEFMDMLDYYHYG